MQFTRALALALLAAACEIGPPQPRPPVPGFDGGVLGLPQVPGDAFLPIGDAGIGDSGVIVVHLDSMP